MHMLNRTLLILQQLATEIRLKPESENWSFLLSTCSGGHAWPIAEREGNHFETSWYTRLCFRVVSFVLKCLYFVFFDVPSTVSTRLFLSFPWWPLQEENIQHTLHYLDFKVQGWFDILHVHCIDVTNGHQFYCVCFGLWCLKAMSLLYI